MTFIERNDDQNNPMPKQKLKESPKRVLVSSADRPHNVMTAAQAIKLVFAIIFIGTILNSSALHTKATAMKPSPIKTVSLAVLNPFDKVSRAIGITSVRQIPREALELGRDDKIDTFSFKNEKKQQPIKKPKVLPVLSPENRLDVWIIGDSLAITPGESMVRSFPTSAFNIQGLQGLVSTGIARPDVFNWFTSINDFVVTAKPQLVIATFGANDDQYLFGSSGPIGPFGSQAWKDEYSLRVSSTLDYLANQGVHAVWIEIPPVRDPERNARYQIINEVTRKATQARPDTTTYVETSVAFTNPDGSYADAIFIDGVPTLLRAPDGIHFTRAGGDIISNLVLEKLRTLYTFE